jgi:predicted KAP-like P-loop ATPase
MQAAATLKSHGFETGSALETTVEMWTSQVKSALQACAHISNHLDYSQKLHTQDDAKIAAVVSGRDGSAMSVSQLNEYFK